MLRLTNGGARQQLASCQNLRSTLRQHDASRQPPDGIRCDGDSEEPLRTLIVAVSALVLLSSSVAFAATVTAPKDRMSACAAQWDGMKKAGKTNRQSYKDFSKSCLSGASAIPSGSKGQCKDGSYTDAISHQGACSGHGGVSQWF